jgi:hypothetical protein
MELNQADCKRQKFPQQCYFLPGLFWLPSGLTFCVVSGILSLP